MAIKTVCFFNSTKEWGGGEKWHHDMALQTHKEGFSVIVFAYEKSILFKKLQKLGVKTIPINVSNLSFLNPIKVVKLKKLFKNLEISHLIINDPADLKLASFAAKLAKVKHVIYRRGSAISIKNSLSNRYIFKNLVTEIIANTQATKDSINQNYNIFPANRIKVIYNGICLEAFDKLENSFQKADTSTLIIGNIGRLVEQKAQHLLIEIAKLLKEKKLNFKIIIGGKGKLEQELKILRDKYELTDKVEFSGFVENSKDFLSKIDIFILSSLWEGFGYVLVEAMACSKATIAFNLSSNPEIIDNNTTGYLIDNKSIESLAEKIIFLSKNKEKMLQLGENGRKKVEQTFSFKVSYSNFIKYLQSL